MDHHYLLALLQKKKSFFESILELTELEATLPVEELIHSLEQKTILLSCIEEVDEELKPYRSALNNLSQEMQDEMDKIKTIVDSIMQLNAENIRQRKVQFKPFISNIDKPV